MIGYEFAFVETRAEKRVGLERVVADFFSMHHREPTFWLEKVCIDKTCIQYGLRNLLADVMAAEPTTCLGSLVESMLTMCFVATGKIT